MNLFDFVLAFALDVTERTPQLFYYVEFYILIKKHNNEKDINFLHKRKL